MLAAGKPDSPVGWLIVSREIALLAGELGRVHRGELERAQQIETELGGELAQIEVALERERPRTGEASRACDRRRARGRRGLRADAAETCLPREVPQPAGVPARHLARRSSRSARLGSRHAAWCVGCCWALMAALFALGVMSLTWLAFVSALIAIEKTLPWRRVATWGTATVLFALAVAVVAAPHAVPDLWSRAG